MFFILPTSTWIEGVTKTMIAEKQHFKQRTQLFEEFHFARQTINEFRNYWLKQLSTYILY
jgi:hypothetical protein